MSRRCPPFCANANSWAARSFWRSDTSCKNSRRGACDRLRNGTRFHNNWSWKSTILLSGVTLVDYMLIICNEPHSMPIEDQGGEYDNTLFSSLATIHGHDWYSANASRVRVNRKLGISTEDHWLCLFQRYNKNVRHLGETFANTCIICILYSILYCVTMCSYRYSTQWK